MSHPKSISRTTRPDETRGWFHPGGLRPGGIRVTARDGAVVRLELWSRVSPEPERRAESGATGADGRTTAAVELALEELRRYFAGESIAFRTPLAPDPAATPFRRRVWEELRRIPYGTTVSYGEIAARVGAPGGARAVGGAVGSNPIPIFIPCHRVVGTTGRLTGFSSGLDLKVKLLELERVRLDLATAVSRRRVVHA